MIFSGATALPALLDILLALAVHHEAVGEARLVGRTSARAHRHQQGGVEPAAVLVATPRGTGPPARRMPARLAAPRRTARRVEPHVQDVRLAAELALAALRAGVARGQEARFTGVRYQTPAPSFSTASATLLISSGGDDRLVAALAVARWGWARPRCAGG